MDALVTESESAHFELVECFNRFHLSPFVAVSRIRIAAVTALPVNKPSKNGIMAALLSDLRRSWGQ